MPPALEIAFVAVLGSFLNVVIHRLPLGQSLASPGSRCPSCGTPIAPYDNVPVVSWLLLRGRCRHCGAPISVRYPAVELLTAGVMPEICSQRASPSSAFQSYVEAGATANAEFARS